MVKRFRVTASRKKCKYIGETYTDLKCDYTESTKSFGVNISYKNGKFLFERSPHKNTILSYKLEPASKRIPKRENLRDVIASFNMGCYAQPICLATMLKDEICPGKL